MDRAPPAPEESISNKRPRLDNLEQFELERALRQSEIDEQERAAAYLSSVAKQTYELFIKSSGPDLLGFLTPSDEASLALTNQTFLSAVLDKSKKRLQRIQLSLPVDETFAMRICQQAVSSANAAVSRRVVYPTRPVLHSAKTVPLYILKKDEPGQQPDQCSGRLALNPSGTRLVVLENSHTVGIYDPKSKPQCIQSFSILHDEAPKAVYYYSTRVVVRTLSTVLAYSETGEFLYAHRVSGNSHVVYSVKHGQNLLLTLGQGRGASIVSFNVHSGVVQDNPKLTAVVRLTGAKLCGVYGDRWLAVHQDSLAAPRGLYVYDLENQGTEAHFLAGSFQSVIQGQGKSASTIYALEDHSTSLKDERYLVELELSKKGRVSEKHRFTLNNEVICPRSRSRGERREARSHLPSIMMASFCSSVCLTSFHEGTKTLEILSTHDGTVRRRTLVVPIHHIAFVLDTNTVSNEKELFLPLFDRRTGQMVIAAYLADEYF